MRKLWISLAFIFQVYTAVLWACCAGEPHNLSELLLHDQRGRYIFQCKVLITYATLNGEYFSKVSIEESFKGEIKASTIIVHTGGNNSAGGHRLQPGSDWLLFGHKIAPNEFAAGVCDHFSCGSEGDPAHYSARLQIVSAYRSITQSKYTGPVVWYYPDSMLLAEGNFKSGKPEGKWKHYRYNGSLKSEAFYKNGLLHGESIEYSEHDEGVSYSTYELGVLVFRKTNYTHDSGSLRGTWEKISENAGMRLVHIKTWHPNGQPSSDFYQEQNYPSNYDWCMYNGFEGAYKHLDSNGNIMSQGQYLKGAKVGKWKEQKKNAREVIEVEYPQPDLPGYDFVRFFEEGQPMLMGNLKQGQANGKWLYYNQKGVLYREANFVEGKLSGEEKQYFHSSGKTSARHEYKNGLLHGEQFKYFEEGAIREQYTCINDLKQGPEVIYLNPGVWQTKANYLDGKLHGDYIGKTYQGDTSLVASFREGALEGVVTEYYKEFKTCKKAVGRYLNGFKEGNWEVFDCNGQLLQTCDFEGDNRQRSYHKSYFDGRCVKKE